MYIPTALPAKLFLSAKKWVFFCLYSVVLLGLFERRCRDRNYRESDYSWMPFRRSDALNTQGSSVIRQSYAGQWMQASQRRAGKTHDGLFDVQTRGGRCPAREKKRYCVSPSVRTIKLKYVCLSINSTLLWIVLPCFGALGMGVIPEIGVCGPSPQNLALFNTKICHLLNPIFALATNLISQCLSRKPIPSFEHVL